MHKLRKEDLDIDNETCIYFAVITGEEWANSEATTTGHNKAFIPGLFYITYFQYALNVSNRHITLYLVYVFPNVHPSILEGSEACEGIVFFKCKSLRVQRIVTEDNS